MLNHLELEINSFRCRKVFVNDSVFMLMAPRCFCVCALCVVCDGDGRWRGHVCMLYVEIKVGMRAVVYLY